PLLSSFPRRPPSSPLLPYTTLFRSGVEQQAEGLGLRLVADPNPRTIEPGQRHRPFGRDIRHPPEFRHRLGAHVPHELVESDFVGDRKSTRLNSSHLGISYAVFCLKK